MRFMERNRSSQMATSLWQKIALMSFGLIIFLVLLETGLHMGGFVLLSIQEYGNLQSIKQKGSFRILCLGESTTRGQYPHLLEQVLNQHNIGVRFSVIDKGKDATNISMILSQVESYLDEYHPDAVVAMMGINEAGKHIPSEAATTSKRTLFIRSLRTYKLARLLWLHLLTKAKEIGLCKPDKDGRGSWKAQPSIPKAGLKETFAPPILTGDPFKKAVEHNPGDDHAYVELGRLYRDQGKLSRAEDSFKKAIELNPKNDMAYVGLGSLYREQEKFLQAADLFKKAIELNPENDKVYVELAWLYRVQYKRLQAEEFYKKAIEINPKNDAAYAGLGWLYRGQSRFSQADDLFKKVIEINPTNDYAIYELGGGYRRLGEFSKAEDLFKKAIELNPKNERVLGSIASLYEEMGKQELAKEYTERTRRLRSEYFSPVTEDSYRKLKKILDQRGIKLVCVQYPMRDVAQLKKIFLEEKNVIFVDNEGVFREALRKGNYKDYFRDMFAGDFGHCTQKGNELLAQNIADVILKEVFSK